MSPKTNRNVDAPLMSIHGGCLSRAYNLQDGQVGEVALSLEIR